MMSGRGVGYRWLWWWGSDDVVGVKEVRGTARRRTVVVVGVVRVV